MLRKRISILLVFLLLIACNNTQQNNIIDPFSAKKKVSLYPLFNEIEFKEWKDEQIRIDIGSHTSIFSLKKISKHSRYLSYYKGLIQSIDNEAGFSGNFKFYDAEVADKHWNEIVAKLNEIHFFDKAFERMHKPRNSVILGTVSYIVVSAYMDGERNEVIRFKQLDDDYEELLKILCLFPSPDTREKSAFNYWCPSDVGSL